MRAGGNFARYSLCHRMSKTLLDAAVGPLKPVPNTLIPAFVTSVVLARQYGYGYAVKNGALGALTTLAMERCSKLFKINKMW